jgi:putative iron-regulated protein
MTVERRTRIWAGLGTAILVGSSTVQGPAISYETIGIEVTGKELPSKLPNRPRVHVAQAEAAGEGGPGEGGGAVLGTITEFRLASQDASAFAYDAKSQVSAYAALVHDTYAATQEAAQALGEAVESLIANPTAESLEAARAAWRTTLTQYLKTEAYQFYAGPVDIPTVSADAPGGPIARLNGWPVDPGVIDGIIADSAQSLNFRALARLNRIEPSVQYTTGLHVIEYLLWGADGALTADVFSGETGARRGEYLAAISRLFANDIGTLVAAWKSGENNYRKSVEAMDQRNALGRAFNGATVLIGYEIPLRRIGAGLFPSNENFQPSRFSDTSEADNRASFEGAKSVYFGAGLDQLVVDADADLAEKLVAGFDRAETALSALNAPYTRFLAPASGSPERQAAQDAVRALTDLARDLRQAANRLGILVVVPGM